MTKDECRERIVQISISVEQARREVAIAERMLVKRQAKLQEIEGQLMKLIVEARRAG